MVLDRSYQSENGRQVVEADDISGNAIGMTSDKCSLRHIRYFLLRRAKRAIIEP